MLLIQWCQNFTAKNKFTLWIPDCCFLLSGTRALKGFLIVLWFEMVSLSSLLNEFEVCGRYMNCSLSYWRHTVSVLLWGWQWEQGEDSIKCRWEASCSSVAQSVSSWVFSEYFRQLALDNECAHSWVGFM